MMIIISLICMALYNYAGSCVDAGFTGCCIGENCAVFAPSLSFSCFCDALCYVFDDCCDDINSIGCYEDDSKFSIIWNKTFLIFVYNISYNSGYSVAIHYSWSD